MSNLINKVKKECGYVDINGNFHTDKEKCLKVNTREALEKAIEYKFPYSTRTDYSYGYATRYKTSDQEVNSNKSKIALALIEDETFYNILKEHRQELDK